MDNNVTQIESHIEPSFNFRRPNLIYMKFERISHMAWSEMLLNRVMSVH